MKKLILVIMVMFMSVVCVSFAGNVMADDNAAVAGEEMTDEVSQSDVAVDEEQPAEAYSEPDSEEAGADMSEEAPADSDSEMQE